jgi:hypothetical protein
VDNASQKQTLLNALNFLKAAEATSNNTAVEVG